MNIIDRSNKLDELMEIEKMAINFVENNSKVKLH
jgi:hypothetical protein